MHKDSILHLFLFLDLCYVWKLMQQKFYIKSVKF